METSGDFTMAGPSQPAGQTAFVGGLDNSGDSGFREGNSGLITEGATWDQALAKETTGAGGDGDDVCRLCTSLLMTAKVQVSSVVY